MSETPLRRSSSAGVDTLVLDSPHNRNALSVAMLEQLLDAVARSAASDARALVLDHAGPAFCSGVDLRERRKLGADAPHSALIAALMRALWAYPAPVLCRVTGPVRGGGMGIIACSDIVVAARSANFAYSEVRVGVAPALVGAVALAKLPLAPLLPWLLTGEPFDALTAQRIGLVARVADDAEDATVAGELAAILRGGPAAVRTVKALCRRLGRVDIDAVIAEAETLSAALFAGDEAREGMAAFAEHRLPAWAKPAAAAPPASAR